jgi:hypothetical protein
MLAHTRSVHGLALLGLVVAIGTALAGVSLRIRYRFGNQIVVRQRPVWFLKVSLAPLLLAGGATLGATGSIHKALGAGIVAVVASWLGELLVRLVPLRRARSFPAEVQPDREDAFKQYIRRV